MNQLPTYELQIKEHHVDSLGHVNNATYLSLFEEARWEAITARGFGFKEVQTNKIGPVILEMNIKFFKEVLLREKIKITLESVSYQGKIGVLKHQMFKADGSLSCEAVMTYGLFDMNLRKLIEPTPEWKKAVNI